MAGTEGERAALIASAREMNWYHSIELEPGFVTAGVFDLRSHVDNYGLPERLEGRRALDVATFDGFWAFEMERRGADVVALDLADANQVDWPAFRPRNTLPTPIGEGFHTARRLLGSEVRRVECSVYDVTTEQLGQFDLIFCGSLLIHLKNQFLALERMRSLLRPGGLLVSCEPYDRLFSLLRLKAARYRAQRDGAAVFWEPSIRTWELMIAACGFTNVRQLSRFTMHSSRGYSVPHVVHQATATEALPPALS